MANESLSADEIAGELIDMVRQTEVGGGRGDTAALVMHGAYLSAFRRLVRIREIAGLGAGEEAVILVRSLLSMVARAIWVDIPDAKEERRARWASYAKRHLLDKLATLDGLKALGFDVDEDVIDFDREQLKKVEDAKGFPSDRQLLEQLNLAEWYHRVYRLSSDYAHFSLGVAIDELYGSDEVHFERDDSELADEALRLATLIYGLFLHLSEKTVRHGLGPRVLETLTSLACAGETQQRDVRRAHPLARPARP